MNITTTTLNHDNTDFDFIDHGINGFELPSDSAQQIAENKLDRLKASPYTVYVATTDPLDFILQVQHWLEKNYFVNDESVITFTAQSQVVQMFKRLN